MRLKRVLKMLYQIDSMEPQDIVMGRGSGRESAWWSERASTKFSTVDLRLSWGLKESLDQSSE